jgi:hypothetical protein
MARAVEVPRMAEGVQNGQVIFKHADCCRVDDDSRRLENGKSVDSAGFFGGSGSRTEDEHGEKIEQIWQEL